LARLIVVSNRVAVPSGDNGNQAGGLAVAVRSLLKRRGLFGQPLEPKQRAKAARLLRARGFADATVEELLGSEAE